MATMAKRKMTAVQSFLDVAEDISAETGVNARVMRITPEVAEAWLVYNTRNRPMHKATHIRYAADIAAEKWDLNGETVKFSLTEDGEPLLIDGQNRLSAVIDSGKPIDTVVVWGLSAEAFETIDIGQRRTFAQLWKMHGRPYGIGVQGVTTFLHTYERRHERQHYRQGLSPVRRFQLIERYPDAVDAVVEAYSRAWLYRHAGSVVALAGFIWAAGRVDEAAKDTFLDALAYGADLGKTSPILRLRNLLIERRELKNYGHRWDWPEYYIRFLVTWDAWRNKQRWNRFPAVSVEMLNEDMDPV